MSDFEDAAAGKPRIGLQHVPVFQNGERVGYLPPGSRPHNLKSRSTMMDIRPSDFTEQDGKIIANKMLGWGDLEAVGVRRASGGSRDLA